MTPLLHPSQIDKNRDSLERLAPHLHPLGKLCNSATHIAVLGTLNDAGCKRVAYDITRFGTIFYSASFCKKNI